MLDSDGVRTSSLIMDVCDGGSRGAARYFKAGPRVGCSSSLVAVSGMNFVLQTVDWLHELGKESDERDEPGGFSPVIPKDYSRPGIVS